MHFKVMLGLKKKSRSHKTFSLNNKENIKYPTFGGAANDT